MFVYRVAKFSTISNDDDDDDIDEDDDNVGMMWMFAALYYLKQINAGVVPVWSMCAVVRIKLAIKIIFAFTFFMFVSQIQRNHWSLFSALLYSTSPCPLIIIHWLICAALHFYLNMSAISFVTHTHTRVLTRKMLPMSEHCRWVATAARVAVATMMHNGTVVALLTAILSWYYLLGASALPNDKSYVRDIRFSSLHFLYTAKLTAKLPNRRAHSCWASQHCSIVSNSN